jgi:hypothetical protein
MRQPALKFCIFAAAIVAMIASAHLRPLAQTTTPATTPTSTGSTPQAAVPPQAANDSGYAAEPIVIEHAESIFNMAADGTGWRQLTFVARLQSDATVKQYGVLSVTYASNSEHVELFYARIRHPDGTVVETQTTDAMDMPSPVTRQAPFYSDQKELQLPIRSLRVGDTLEFKYRIVRTKAEAPGQFWGQEVFSAAAVVLSQTAELRVPTGMYVNVWSPGIKPVETSTAATADAPGQHIYLWSYSQLKPTVGKEAEAEAAAKKKILWTADQELDLEQGKLPTIAWSTFKSWEEVGEWYRALEADRIIPDDTVKAKAAELTAGKSTDEAKARALYDYVATNIRYIGVAFGIGRYQPHTAAEILSNQYGDCKDKHTLLAAMLSAVGIQSDAVLIGAGIRFNEAVPSPASFNHVITHLTLAGKPVWLDTTAEVAPFGMLVSPTRDKQALVIPSAPSAVATIVRTPVDPLFPNVVTVEAAGSLDANGVSTSRIAITFRGDSEITARAAFRMLPPDKYDQVVQLIAKGIGFAGTTSNPEITRPTDMTQPFKLSFDYKREKAGDWEHLRTLPEVVPTRFPQVTEMEPPVHAIQLGEPGTETSTSAMKLPEGWSAILPPAVHAKCNYATYDMTYRLENGTVYADRKIVVLAKKVSVSDWRAYKALVDMVNPGKERYIQLMTASASRSPEQRTKQIEDALNSPDPIIKNTAVAAEDTRDAYVASEYVTQLAGMGDVGATRLAVSRAAMTAETAAAVAETAAAAVESDASQATAASAAGDRASVNNARDKAAADYSALLAADDQLTTAAKALAAATADNVAFYAANPVNAAINDMGARDCAAASNLLSVATKGGTAGYSAAAANETTAIKDANTIAGLDRSRAPAFKAVAKAEAEAQSAATAAAAGSASAAAAAATAGATADGPGNPYAGAVEIGAAAVANAASATISAQHAMDRLKTLK